MKSFKFVFDRDVFTGIGQISNSLIYSCLKQKVEIEVSPVKSGHHVDTLYENVFLHCDIRQAVGLTRTKNSVLMTYWESDRVPSDLVVGLNQFRAIIVPSQYVKKAFVRSGVIVPVHVVPLGIDMSVFKPDLAHLPKECIFASSAHTIQGMKRKNLNLLVHAFLYAFPYENDVCLRLKLLETSEHINNYSARIQVIRKALVENELVRYYQEATAFISPSTCEGFGLHGLQAIACGKPLVSVAYSGETEYFKPGQNGYKIEHKLEKARDVYYKIGNWARPNFDSLVAQLRYIYENRTDAFLMGLQGVQSVRSFTVENMTYGILQVLNRYL